MKKRAMIAAVSLMFILLFIFLRPGGLHQQKFEPAIVTLIDRAPSGLFPGQVPDVTGRRFLPLLEAYRLEPQTDPDRLDFTPKSTAHVPLRFVVIRDENTRAMKFLRGEADVLYDTLAISKTEWLKKNHPEFRVYSRSGLNLSYLGFSLQHPILKNREVRRAIAGALPVADWARHKLLGWVDVATDLVQIPFDPDRSARELDRLGHPVREDGRRFALKYYTTGVREGAETALLTQEALRKIGIEIQVVTLDTLLYFQKMRKGQADLFSTRWFRFTEREPIAEYLATGGTRNYFGYSNPKLDRRLKSNPVLDARELSRILNEDFPFFPLYYWRHGLVLSPRVQVEHETRLVSSLDETFRFLTLLGLK